MSYAVLYTLLYRLHRLIRTVGTVGIWIFAVYAALTLAAAFAGGDGLAAWAAFLPPILWATAFVAGRHFSGRLFGVALNRIALAHQRKHW
mgnify:FL=1